MTGKTISEKILSAKSGQDARAGDIVVCEFDRLIATDGSMPMTIDYFNRMNGTKVSAPDRVVVSLDHYSPPPNRETAILHQTIRRFSETTGVGVYAMGQGISHQLMLEAGSAAPGALIIGADSHTVTCGALNAFATGVGSSDLAAAMITGKVWLRIPETICIELTGALQPGCDTKDVVLHLISILKLDGANYQSLEFLGTAIQDLTIDDRALLANMSVEMGAKAGLFEIDACAAKYLEERGVGTGAACTSDPDARFSRKIEIDLGRVEPRLALPHSVDNISDVGSARGEEAHMVYIGTCSGGRSSDLRKAMSLIDAAGGFAKGVQVFFTPASAATLADVTRDGTLARFVGFGGIVQTAGCGSCCGTCGVIPGDGVNVISTANRNFKGRMGNAEARIFLASPQSCAAAAITGRITDPRDLLP
jgi:3-isopropylmalate/(R)-2-methylmalate dehydratase large subunit